MKATTEFKEVRNRYLFAIEDPFEIEHNVARTVTHNGIVSIRDEFRRAWRIIKAAGRGPPGVAGSSGVPQQPPEDLLEDINAKKEMEGRQIECRGEYSTERLTVNCSFEKSDNLKG